MTNYYDVVIVGGGVIGCAIARELTRYPLKIALLERDCDVGFGTSKANSGIIHGGHHANPRTLKGQLEWAGNQMWDALCVDLGFGFRRIGELTVALSDGQLPVLRELQENGTVRGIHGLEIWDCEKVLKAEPNLTASVVAALYSPTTGVVNPYEVCFALAESAQLNGLALFLNCPLTGLSYSNGLWSLTTPRGILQARYVVNAAGLYADAVADLADARTFTISPRKGEEFLLDKRLCGLVQHVIFPCPTPVSKGILVIPTYDGTLMVGPTAHDVEVKDDVATSTAGAEEVFASVRQLVPGISERDVIAQFAGVRAAAADQDFVIGPTVKKGFINVAGIQSPGLTAAPAIAVRVVDILRSEGLSLVPKDNFMASLPKPVHFMSLGSEAQVALAESDPRYRRMVCRCEFVTEGAVQIRSTASNFAPEQGWVAAKADFAPLVVSSSWPTNDRYLGPQ